MRLKFFLVFFLVNFEPKKHLPSPLFPPLLPRWYLTQREGEEGNEIYCSLLLLLLLSRKILFGDTKNREKGTKKRTRGGGHATLFLRGKDSVGRAPFSENSCSLEGRWYRSRPAALQIEACKSTAYFLVSTPLLWWGETHFRVFRCLFSSHNCICLQPGKHMWWRE